MKDLDELRSMSTADVLSTRIVWLDMCVSYGGVKYDVSGMPDVRTGELVIVRPNPGQAETVRVTRVPSAGNNSVYVAPEADPDMPEHESGRVVIGPTDV